MKEATGELNMTVIVSISIGILAAFFFTVLWPMINGNFQRNSQCNKAVCDCAKSTRESIENETGKKNYCKCYDNEDGSKDITFYCPFKG